MSPFVVSLIGVGKEERITRQKDWRTSTYWRDDPNSFERRHYAEGYRLWGRTGPVRDCCRSGCIGKGNVARRHVLHVNAMRFESPKNRLNLRPEPAELLLLVGAPIGEDFLWEVRGMVEIGPGEIENKGTDDDRHFDDPRM